MATQRILTQITDSVAQGKKMLAVLLDPDKLQFEQLSDKVDRIEAAGAEMIFVGGSLLLNEDFEKSLKVLRQLSDLPLVIFPGSAYQVSPEADAILFLTLLSGRNPDYLIHNQMMAAPHVRNAGLEAIATAYLLVDGGAPTSVSYMSNTQPIPRDKNDIAVATALAAQYMGQSMVYLEAGSGAPLEVPSQMISAVKSQVDLPLIVGGGIDSPRKMEKALRAGADVVVIGNAFERDPDILKAFHDTAAAIKS